MEQAIREILYSCLFDLNAVTKNFRVKKLLSPFSPGVQDGCGVQQALNKYLRTASMYGMRPGIGDIDAHSQRRALRNLVALTSTKHCKPTQRILRSPLKPHGVESGLHFAGKITSVGMDGPDQRGK